MSHVRKVRDKEKFRNQHRLVNHSFRTTLNIQMAEAGLEDSTRYSILSGVTTLIKFTKILNIKNISVKKSY